MSDANIQAEAEIMAMDILNAIHPHIVEAVATVLALGLTDDQLKAINRSQSKEDILRDVITQAGNDADIETLRAFFYAKCHGMSAEAKKKSFQRAMKKLNMVMA